MSGIPRPVNDLPDRTISVRVIRGDMSNNLANQPVEFTVDGKAQTGDDQRERSRGDRGTERRSGDQGGDDRRRRDGSSPPSSRRRRSGGVRLLLVATDKEKEAKAAADAAGARRPRAWSILAGETRLVVEPDEENVRVYLPARHHQQRTHQGDSDERRSSSTLPTGAASDADGRLVAPGTAHWHARSRQRPVRAGRHVRADWLRRCR